MSAASGKVAALRGAAITLADAADEFLGTHRLANPTTHRAEPPWWRNRRLGDEDYFQECCTATPPRSPRAHRRPPQTTTVTHRVTDIFAAINRQ
ncbi:hypothetical protein [Nonomuraea sp. NPDC050691]|uniref:hypothetical protein n=1 Tax=Nonomuraea sp. NPDC050691 TaxID=3155661 RepID=UPI0033F93B8A